jgi:hypothetical protein
MATSGGPAKAVSVKTGGRQAGGPAIPIAVVTDGRAVEGGPATPIYIVTSGPVQGGPAQPVVAAAAGRAISGGPAVPAFVVSGSFSSIFDYTNKVKALSPIAYWPLAEASGTTVLDESGNGRNGVYKAAGEPLLGQPGIGDGRTAPLFDGTNDFANVFSASLAAAFSGAEGTVACWCQVANAGVWTDATTRRALYLQADTNNRVILNKTITNNQVTGFHIAGGTSKQVLFNTTGPLTWFHLAMTWSKSADQMKFFVNGTQQGATQTGLGTFVGSLAATTTTIGAADTVGTAPWAGSLAHAAVWATPLSPTQIASLAVVP